MSKYQVQTLHGPFVRGRYANPLKGLLTTLVAWQQRYELRRHLLEMDERLLDDIGLSRAMAEREAAKPFWRD